MKFIQIIKNIIITGRFFRIAKKHFEPDKNFLKESKILFLRQMKEKKIIGNVNFAKERISIFPLLKTPAYALASFALLFLMSAGTVAVAFADTQDVGPDNLLYGLKRAGETVQIQLAPKEKKPELHQKFAERRVKEIKKIKSAPVQKAENKQEIIKELDENFRKNVTAVAETINVAVEREIKKEIKSEEMPKKPELLKSDGLRKSKNLCWQVMDIIKEREEMDGNGFKGKNPNASLPLVKEKCGNILKKTEKDK